MISQAAADQHLTTVWLLLVAASAGVFLHAGIKFPWFVFFQKDSGLRPKDPPWNMRAAMILFAAACIALGVFPQWLYGLLPYPVDYEPYTASHLVSQFQLLLFSGLAFFALLPLMKRTLTLSLDTDWLWRVAGFHLGRGMVNGLARLRAGAIQAGDVIWRQVANGSWRHTALAYQSTSRMLSWALLVLLILVSAKFLL